MKVLVTGANGHIGSHVVRAVLDEGWQAIAMVRPGSDRRALSGLSCEIRDGDLRDPASVERATQGADAVMHVGAIHRNADPGPDEMHHTAIDGTRAVFEAARKHGIKRVVLTSSGATVGFAKDPTRPLDESHRQERIASPYIRAKVEQERLALELSRSLGVELVILNPSGVFGPRDYRLTPASRAFIGLLQGDPAFLHICLTDVRDVGRAHVLGLQDGASGERYLITGDNVTPKALSALLGELGGVRPPAFRPPVFLLRFLIGQAEKKARKEGSDPMSTVAALEDLDRGNLAYDSTRSRRELGMTYRDGRGVVRDTLRWLLFMDAFKPKIAAKVRAALGESAAPDSDWTR